MVSPLRIVAIAVAAVLLTGFFIYLGFPYDRLGESLSVRVEQATGTRISLGRVDSKLFLLGPGLIATDVNVQTTSGNAWSFQSLAVRPAWSLDWLTGRPTLYLDATAPYGRFQGVAVLAEPYAFDGEALGIDIAALPIARYLPGADVTGRADVVADLSFEETGLVGPLQLTATAGSLAHPSLPLGIPYDELVGSLRFGGEQAVSISNLDIQSPLGSGSIRGTIGHAPNPSSAALDLEMDLKAGSAIQATFKSQGVDFGRDGTLAVKVTGTAARPRVH